MTFWQQMLILIIGAVLQVAVLGFIGQRIVAYWDARKKRQETDIAISTQLQQVYGEFKEGSKLWRTFYRKTYYGKYPELEIPEDVRWESLKSATAAESSLEAILVKLATERRFKDDAAYNLGMFRQGYQQLRESIRKNKEPLFTSYNDPRYNRFDDYACKVAHIISTAKRPSKLHGLLGYSELKPEEAAANLRKILIVRSKDWEDQEEARSAMEERKEPKVPARTPNDANQRQRQNSAAPAPKRSKPWAFVLVAFAILCVIGLFIVVWLVPTPQIFTQSI